MEIKGEYFIVYLEDYKGIRPLMFNKKCNAFESTDNGKLIYFYHEFEDGKKIVLGIIPYENISYIENCIDWDKEV